MPKDVNNLARSLGISVMKWGENLLKKSVRLNPEIAQDSQLKGRLNSLPSLSLSDKRYYVIPWEKWLTLIKVDWTDERKYKTDNFDCDNFAFAFSARMSTVYGINTAGVAYGKMVYKDGKTIGHAFNLIVATDKIMVYEPQSDEYTPFSDSMKIKGREYKINWALYF